MLAEEIFPQEYVITWNERDFAVYCADSDEMVAAWALHFGTQKAGYFNTDTGEFSGFLWKQISLSDRDEITFRWSAVHSRI